MHFLLRTLIVFVVGVLLSLALLILQIERNVALFPPGVLSDLSSIPWWVPISCGAGAATIGLSLPKMDEWFQRKYDYHHDQVEWVGVLRCVGIFVGITYASTLAYNSVIAKFSVSLSLMAIGQWWLFDRSVSGFVLGVAVSFTATAVTQIIVHYGIFSFSKPDFLSIRSWLPGVFFSATIAIGSLGRQLAQVTFHLSVYQFQ
ncbi:uncharacterized protein TRIADDRAFT_29414 [Trichoplax adhaerens]|uniref:Insulin-induced gene 1 protein n=1 Tax=Trichoplax adhaerens TaxID=10228 RepID=B3S4T4_TRIAD|nr:hypothetical protein TRIADDRAFT_29414 [Trichoplax adhaerens]EDV22141.1 hypothetical protein TRIADDRAFT_29414 [Trichoplax adhaerens]|eukprot:XP_002115296.1 hypothetical protein TRIADDRAFT_29414 [Trichoplax adhaerens]